MRFCSTLCCVLALFVFGGPELAARTVDPSARPTGAPFRGTHVRGATPRMCRLLEEAIKRSPTFATLVAALRDTNVIVHVEETIHLPVGVDGRLSFVTAAGGVRYLRAQVAAGRGLIDTMAVVGHELQHAVEVALHDEVRDQDTFRALYQRIGDHPAHADRFDTAAARDAGRRVRNEMN